MECEQAKGRMLIKSAGEKRAECFIRLCLIHRDSGRW